VISDDLLCTNGDRALRAADSRAADMLLLKVNQADCLTDAVAALDCARGAGWGVVVSARSGETADSWLADFAVGWAADSIKVDSIRQSERLAKYNRLLEIESGIARPAG
jgi:enolase